MMKLRIAVFSNTTKFWGGSYQYARALTEALADLDPDKFEIQVWHHDDEKWNELCARLGFREHIFGSFNFPPFFVPLGQKLLESIKKLTKNNDDGRFALIKSLDSYSTDAELDAWHPHVVILPQQDNFRYVKGAKHIGVIHDLMHRYESRFSIMFSSSKEEQMYEFQVRDKLAQCIVENSDALLVDSHLGATQVLQTYHKAKKNQIYVLPFTAFSEITECEPKEPNFALPEKFFFYPSKFWEHKNHVGLAKAVALLKQELPDICVVAAGNTDQNGYAPFMEIVKKEELEKNFLLPGYLSVEELAWLYHHARALVMPTFLGPTNIPPLEAMALGCPVAVSGIYAMPEQCGDAALYFKPDDPADIAKVLRQLWNDDPLCQTLREKGLQRFHSYDLKAFTNRVLEIVNKVCSDIKPQIEEITQYPKFSIIIPTYNRASMLHYTLDSMLAQKYPEDKFEIIVCNNNSTDDSQEILKSYATKYPKRIVPLFEERQGVHYARNISACFSNGDILYYTDDDMVANEQMLSAFAEFFARHPEVGSATGRVRPLWEATPPEWILRSCDNSLLSLSDLGMEELIHPKDFGVYCCHMATPRKIFFATHGSHPDFFDGEILGDGEPGLNRTIAKLGWHFGYTPSALTLHMIPPSRMTQDYLNKRRANQGNSDSYTEYRDHHFTHEELFLRQALHSAQAKGFQDAYKKLFHSNDIRWHLALAQVQYHLHRKSYEKRIMDDPSWREFVLKDDWLEDALEEAKDTSRFRTDCF